MTLEEIMSAQKVTGEDTQTHTCKADPEVAMERPWRSDSKLGERMERLGVVNGAGETVNTTTTTQLNNMTPSLTCVKNRLIRETHSHPDRGEKPPSSDQPADTNKK